MPEPIEMTLSALQKILLPKEQSTYESDTLARMFQDRLTQVLKDAVKEAASWGLNPDKVKIVISTTYR